MAKRILWVLVLGGCSFLGGLAAVLLNARLELIARAQPAPREAQPAVVTDLVAISDRFELVAKKVAPAVVYVEAKRPAEKPGAAKGTEESGSGVIVKLDGRREPLVFTNNHVIANAGANRIIVHLADGRVMRPSKVWTDPETDVAVLSIEGVENLPSVGLGDSDQIQVGSWVLAIGSPFGLNQTVTHGILSARERGQISLGNHIRIKDFLQTDASINPGSSGGPLLNLNGEVIGINTAIASPNGSNTGVSFSIPINLFKRIAVQLLEKGSVARGYLGIQLASTFEPADALKLGLDKVQGALVEAVYPNTPAAQAGIKPGDVILEADGTAIRNENHLINLISGTPAGKALSLSIWREGKRMSVNAVVGDWAAGQERLRSGP